MLIVALLLMLLLPPMLLLLLLLLLLLPLLHQRHVFLVQRSRLLATTKALLAPGIKRMSRSLWLSVTT